MNNQRKEKKRTKEVGNGGKSKKRIKCCASKTNVAICW